MRSVWFHACAAAGTAAYARFFGRGRPGGRPVLLQKHTQLLIFFGAVTLMALAGGVHESIFNNFLSDTFNLAPAARGWLELPRELPGFLVVVFAAALVGMPLTRLASLSAGIFCLGLIGMATVGHWFAPMMLVMMLTSVGMHLIQPVGASIIIGLSSEENRGKRMGQMGAVGTIGVMVGSGFIWLVFDRVNPSYAKGFLLSAGFVGGAALLYGIMRVDRPLRQERPPRMVFHKRFNLYYLLELLFGARKQVFLTFGPWVLVRVYDQPATSVAMLFMIASFIGIAFKPLVGMAIDRFGERTVLVADGLMLSVVCLGYGYAAVIMPDADSARLLACVCFVADDLLFALGTGRTIYVSRLTKTREELTSTLAMGVSINHVVSMTIPIAAGAVWAGFGYDKLFLAAAFLALIISAVASRVPGRRRPLAPERVKAVDIPARNVISKRGSQEGDSAMEGID